MEEMLNFSEALILIKHGRQMTRKGWNGKNMYIELQSPDLGSKMSPPYICMKTAQ